MTGLKNALSSGKDVKLSSDIALTESLQIPVGANVTIDLGNYSMTSSSDVFTVPEGATLTINGTDEAEVVSGNTGSVCAVWAPGGTVIINGGYFKAGVDENGNRMDCIYAGSNSDASDNPGKIIINGGKFEFAGNYSVDESEAGYNIAKDGDRFLLNCADNDDSALITVNGGKFKNHVPGKENVGDGEVVLGTDKKVYNVNTGVEITEKHTGTEAVWYEVR